MMQKEKYEQPQMEIIRFETEDVITTSGGDTTGGSGSLTPVGGSRSAGNGGWGD